MYQIKKNTLVDGQVQLWHYFEGIGKNQAWSIGYKTSIYGVRINVFGTMDDKGEMLYLASDQTLSWAAVEQYKRRWGAENMHQSLKTRCFRMEDSRITQHHRLNVLMNCIAMAFIWGCQAGKIADSENPIAILAHGRPQYTFLRYGFDAIREEIRGLKFDLLEKVLLSFAGIPKMKRVSCRAVP